MQCIDENVALDFVVGTLPGDTATDVEAHMARCDSCRRLVAELAKAGSGDEQQDDHEKPTNSSAIGPVSVTPHTRPLSGPRTKLDRGTQIGRYTILYRLGEGGMGAVHAAYDPKLDRQVALKFVRDDIKSETTSSHHKRLVREARALARLSHPNVVNIYDVAVHEDHVYLAMELVQGSDARRWIEFGKRSTREIVEVYLGAIAALSAAHSQGVIHRDFKPDNVLVGADGITRVTDFGLARGADAEMSMHASYTKGSLATVTATGWAVGTPRYMAPEQFRGQADEKSDQFALCLSMYEAVFGHYPFGTTSPKDLDPQRTLEQQCLTPLDADQRELRRVLLRGMAIDPADRWPSLNRLEAELLVILAPRPKRFWQMATVGAVVAALAAAVIVIPADESESGPTSNDRTEEIATLNRDLEALRAQLREYEGSDARRLELESRLAETQEQLSRVLSDQDGPEADTSASTGKRRPRAEALPPPTVERAVHVRLGEILACYGDSVRGRDDREFVRAAIGVDETGSITWTRPPYQGSPTAARCLDSVLRRLALPKWPEKTTATVDMTFYRLDTGALGAQVDVKTRAAGSRAVRTDGSGRVLIDCNPQDPLCGLEPGRRVD